MARGKIITVTTTKGGAGKSTISRALGEALALLKNSEGKDNRVCIIDMDENGHIAHLEGNDRDDFMSTAYDWLTGDVEVTDVLQQVKRADNTKMELYYIPGDGKINDYETWIEKRYRKPQDRINAFKNMTEPLRDVFDFILIDMHPSERIIMAYVYEATDFALFPLEASQGSAENLQRDVQVFVDDYVYDPAYNVDYGIIPNQIRNDAAWLRRYESVKSHLGLPEEKFLTALPKSEILPNAEGKGMLIQDYPHMRAQDLLDILKVIANEIILKLEKAVAV